MHTHFDNIPIELIARRFEQLQGDLQIVPLTGGLTNRNFRVIAADRNYFLRVSEAQSGLLGINRSHERWNSERAHTAGVAPAVLGSSCNPDALLIEWIEGETMSSERLRDHTILPFAARALKQLHSGPSFEGQFYFPVVRRQYLRTVQNMNLHVPDNYFQVEPIVARLEDALQASPEPFVSCNNDLLPENFMLSKDWLWIIDYEYAGMNEASFDIGNLAGESALSDEALALFCDTYWNGHLPQKIARAKAWSMIARFGWVLWASIQEAVSPLDFDFRQWGLNKFQSVYPELLSDRTTELINILKHNP